MFKNKFVSLLILGFLTLSALLYCVGFYNGARKAFLFNATMDTAVYVNTIKYIDNQQYEKAKNVQLSELEVNRATIADISNDNLSIKNIYKKFNSYRTLLSYDEGKYIDIAKKGYDHMKK